MSKEVCAYTPLCLDNVHLQERDPEIINFFEHPSSGSSTEPSEVYPLMPHQQHRVPRRESPNYPQDRMDMPLQESSSPGYQNLHNNFRSSPNFGLQRGHPTMRASPLVPNWHGEQLDSAGSRLRRTDLPAGQQRPQQRAQQGRRHRQGSNNGSQTNSDGMLPFDGHYHHPFGGQ